MRTSKRKTEVLYGAENAVQRGVQFMSNVQKKMDIYFDNTAPSIVISINEYKNSYRDIRRRGGKIRLITDITSKNINYCKQLIHLVDEFRHLDGIKGGLAVSETEFMATTLLQEAKPLTQVIYSNVKEVVEQGQYIFDTLWTNSAAIPAKLRLKEIEQGVTREFMETIREPAEAKKLAFDLVKIASDEILILFPTASTFQSKEREGLRQLLKEAARERNVKIRLLFGSDGSVKKEMMEKLKRNSETIDIQSLKTPLKTKLLVILIDKALCLTIELKDDVQDPYEAIGLTMYSNSQSTVLSYTSIFESLWIQRELQEEKRRGTASQA
jgi:two-component system, OmpR family, sensor histidine kinase VicK